MKIDGFDPSDLSKFPTMITVGELKELIEKARKWENHQQEIALANAAVDRFVTLMQSDEDKLRTDAEKWRKVKECADSRPPCKCPLWYNDACNLEYGGCIFRDVVDALEAEVKG